MSTEYSPLNHYGIVFVLHCSWNFLRHFKIVSIAVKTIIKLLYKDLPFFINKITFVTQKETRKWLNKHFNHSQKVWCIIILFVRDFKVYLVKAVNLSSLNNKMWKQEVEKNSSHFKMAQLINYSANCFTCLILLKKLFCFRINLLCLLISLVISFWWIYAYLKLECTMLMKQFYQIENKSN